MTAYKPEGRLINCPDNQYSLKNKLTLTDAMHERRILEAKAGICDCSHNLIVDLGCMKGIIPREEGAVGIREGTVRDIAIISRVGKPVCFYVEEFFTDSAGNTAAKLSRRAVQQDCIDNMLCKLSAGDIIDARITHLEPFGAFADIGCGIPSLLPIDAISVSRISHPHDRFTVGMDIRAIVKNVDSPTRIALTHKELLGTWEENVSDFRPGETVEGIVRSSEEYGVFIELTPNLAGLAEANPSVHAGQQASVYIKSIVPSRMKIKLVMIDVFDAKAVPGTPKYFFCGDHMDRFVYSPAEAEKTIETVFAI